MDPVLEASQSMNSAITELTQRIEQIRPAMSEILLRTRVLENELVLIGNHISLLENTIDSLEIALHKVQENQKV